MSSSLIEGTVTVEKRTHAESALAGANSPETFLAARDTIAGRAKQVPINRQNLMILFSFLIIVVLVQGELNCSG